MKKSLSPICTLIFIVTLFFCITEAAITFAANAAPPKLEGAHSCAVCEKVMKKLIIADTASTCPVMAANFGMFCEAAFAAETEGAATLVCAGISIAVDIVCTEFGKPEEVRKHADKAARIICEKKLHACKK